MRRVKLTFMVVPEELKRRAYVPNAVRIKVVDPDAIFLTGILGESGRKLVKGGVDFYFEKRLAEKLISRGIAVRVVGRRKRTVTARHWATVGNPEGP